MLSDCRQYVDSLCALLTKSYASQIRIPFILIFFLLRPTNQRFDQHEPAHVHFTALTRCLIVKVQILISESSFTVILSALWSHFAELFLCKQRSNRQRMTVRQSREAEVVQPHRCDASASLQPTPRPSSVCARNRPRVHSMPHKSTCISGDIQRSSTPSFHFLLNICQTVCVGRQSAKIAPQQSAVRFLASYTLMCNVALRYFSRQLCEKPFWVFFRLATPWGM